jgi:shikimate dehydrogenase
MEYYNHKLFGIIGHPVFHSKSPNILRSIFGKYNIDASYMRIAVDWIDDGIRLCKDLELDGLNITAPFKNTVISHLDELSKEVNAINSVNTIVNLNGKLKGYNTDYSGASLPFEHRLDSLKFKRVIVLGAGGAGLSAAFGLSSLGSSVIVLNRTMKDFGATALKINASYDSLANLKKHIKEADIIVSTLPYEAEPVDISSMKKGSMFLDASYKKTHYKDICERFGITFISGEEWLAYQAIYACKQFVGIILDYETVYSEAVKPRREKNIISLVGFMGAGKSSVGRELASMKRMDFVDIDEVIESKMSRSINEIFTAMGEEKFREIESDILKSFKGAKNLVMSCGGGIPVREENREFLINETEPIWIYCDMDSTAKRVLNGKRPIINSMRDTKEIHELFNKRKKYYASTCESVVLSKDSPKATAEFINEEIRLSF